MTEQNESLREAPEQRRRHGTRYLVSVPVEYGDGLSSLRGKIVELSASGALIEGPQAGGEIGALLTLRFFCFGTAQPIELGVQVVRPTEGGFAARFLDPEPFLRALLQIATLHLEEAERNGLGVAEGG